MKKNIFISILFTSNVAFSSTKADLDYCATVESWATQQVIESAFEKNKQLDKLKATSFLIERTKLMDGRKEIKFEDWGQLYTQTIKVIIPYVNNQKKKVTFIASSIISAEECSLGMPSYFDITPDNYIFNKI
ncbi:hypothetical protein [Xenorhabdus griffiniae]|uniref:Uncharacterized protein n=1 Tax=Xenorhabdus griffiniae TaxID=351672 RepID=A0ABY9XH19_9GAMM|nr:hypothetical protein [Xenorhabdus griffiniae]MBD1227959.1 hypothetical protein [Xenorhabdus griffiniae]MBE8588347.1 hypothetical protein [Xenorhabdus griffiniae]WMV72237.1 hypothetical protein QL128_19445 [Xenorhabdus griffiniae]WNH01915.1 hypothetical protein QL112_019455 [Xenorhabdus griffiniae]